MSIFQVTSFNLARRLPFIYLWSFNSYFVTNINQAHPPPQAPPAPGSPKGILRPARRTSSPASVHFSDDTLPPAPGPPGAHKSADKQDKRSKKRESKKDRKGDKKVEKRAEKKSRERGPGAPPPPPPPPGHPEKQSLPAQAEEVDVTESPAKTEKGPKPEKASKTSSKKQKKSDKGGKGKDKGKSKAIAAPIAPGTCDALPSGGAIDPSPEQEPDSLDDGADEDEAKSEPIAETVSPDPALGLQKEEENENVVDDSTPPAEPAAAPEEAQSPENLAAPADVEQQSEASENADPAPATATEFPKETSVEIKSPETEELSPAEPEDEAVEPQIEAGKLILSQNLFYFNTSRDF